tara:strand:+ start:81 stop:485 length:405 start_codon:yes stop_codon:yes gene_type:complete
MMAENIADLFMQMLQGPSPFSNAQGPMTIGRTSEGRNMVYAPGHGLRTEYTSTVKDPRINNGAFTNIPTIFGGTDPISPDAAADIIAGNNGVDPETGIQLNGFQNEEDAIKFAKFRSGSLDREINKIFKKRGIR